MKNRSENRKKVRLWAMTVALLTFPLIWLGGLVTTHDAGMAVPDWPGTYGYNMFLYPWTTWIFGPIDLCVEHGHRLLASLVGFLAIILCIIAYRNESRGWVRGTTYILLLAIISQGLLGGIRVLFDARVMALIHGCFGPLVFALACWIAMITSEHWIEAKQEIKSSGLRWICRVLFVATIVQLILGAHLRHALPNWKPSLFFSFVHTHLFLASLVTCLIVSAFLMTSLSKNPTVKSLRLPASWLLFLVLVQLALGCGTWIMSYALPWQEWIEFLARYTINGRGFLETMIISGHQATGSLLIVGSLWLLCRVERQFAWGKTSAVSTVTHPLTL